MGAASSARRVSSDQAQLLRRRVVLLGPMRLQRLRVPELARAEQQRLLLEAARLVGRVHIEREPRAVGIAHADRDGAAQHQLRVGAHAVVLDGAVGVGELLEVRLVDQALRRH